MKTSVFMAMILAGGTLFPPVLCLADIEAGPGLHDHHEIIRIGPAPRAELRYYLSLEYERQCTTPGNPPPVCSETKPLYIGSGLPGEGTHPLPPDVIRKLGFIQPGTTYVQRGFVVYLITLPRRIILDNVTATDKSSDIQWNAP